MTDNTQPEALRLADWLDGCGGLTSKSAAAELRRQNALIAELNDRVAKGFDAADMATASAQGFRDGVASVAATAGSEPVATVFTMESLAPGGGVKYHATVHKPLPAGTKLYTHPSPPEGMVGGWMPIETAPKNGRTLLLGYFNSAGKWRTTRGQWMSQDYIDEYAEDPDFMSPGWHETTVEDDDGKCWPINPTHWIPTPPPPTSSADSRKGE